MDLLLLIGELALARAKHNICSPDGEGPGNTHSVADQIGLVVVVGTGGFYASQLFPKSQFLVPSMAQHPVPGWQCRHGLEVDQQHVMWSLLSVMGFCSPSRNSAVGMWSEWCGRGHIILPACVPFDHTIWLGKKNIAERRYQYPCFSKKRRRRGQTHDKICLGFKKSNLHH